ncbi:DUF3108 domain-containing protein [Microvirga thermotolerans]|uniref:DUF3108 domain-containing protein n=1 Tax=Microvirga thermotolerans TaxID=2651334 RepID=A0A5P9JSX9_9HYPH|nr:DUF3108 domain-containing protein [Microvirga thermotolerans]QFU15211.1 DUF3108 domain-containing protein [Microvirga thermotolerans]
MRMIAPAALALAVLGFGAPGKAQTLQVEYDVTLAGLTLGKADLTSTFEGPKYKMQAGVKLSGLAKLLTGGKGAATAAGVIAGAQPQPASFAITSRSSDDQRTVRMGLASGNVEAVEIDPPLEEKPDRVPLKEADKKGVVDPISALLMPAVSSGSVRDAANCNRTIPVFDGAARFDVVLSYSETRQADVPGYKGPVLVCKARYVPISGHRALRPSTKFMEENKDMSVWLVPLERQRLLVPLRVSVRTMIGVSVVEASKWAFDDTAKGLPASADNAVKAGAFR